MRKPDPKQRKDKARSGLSAEHRHSQLPGKQMRHSLEPPLSPLTALTSEVLILPDGQVLAHDLTPAFTALLHELNPQDAQFAPRQAASAHLTHSVPRNTNARTRTRTRTNRQTLP